MSDWIALLSGVGALLVSISGAWLAQRRLPGQQQMDVAQARDLLSQIDTRLWERAREEIEHCRKLRVRVYRLERIVRQLQDLLLRNGINIPAYAMINEDTDQTEE